MTLQPMGIKKIKSTAVSVDDIEGIQMMNDTQMTLFMKSGRAIELNDEQAKLLDLYQTWVASKGGIA